MLNKRQKKSWSISPLQWTQRNICRNANWGLYSKAVALFKYHKITDIWILLLPHGHIASWSSWGTANSKSNQRNIKTWRCWENCTMTSSGRGVQLCCGGLLCYSSVSEKVKQEQRGWLKTRNAFHMGSIWTYQSSSVRKTDSRDL